MEREANTCVLNGGRQILWGSLWRFWTSLSLYRSTRCCPRGFGETRAWRRSDINNIPIGIGRRTGGTGTSTTSSRSRDYWSTIFILGLTPPFHQKFVCTFGENTLLFLVMISQSKSRDGGFNRSQKSTICFLNHQRQILLIVVALDRFCQTFEKVSTELMKIKMGSIDDRTWQSTVFFFDFPCATIDFTD